MIQSVRSCIRSIRRPELLGEQRHRLDERGEVLGAKNRRDDLRILGLEPQLDVPADHAADNLPVVHRSIVA